MISEILFGRYIFGPASALFLFGLSRTFGLTTYTILFYFIRASRNSGGHTGVRMRYQDGVWVKGRLFHFSRHLFVEQTEWLLCLVCHRSGNLYGLIDYSEITAGRMQLGRIPGDRQLPLLLFTVYKFSPTARGDTCRNCTLDRIACLTS